MHISSKNLAIAVPDDMPETKARLIKAAAKVFAENGLKGSSVRMIAKEAGVANQLITYHFGNKENLWTDVVNYMFDQRHFSHEIDEFDENANIDELTEQLRKTLISSLTYTPEKIVLRKIMAQEALGESPLYKKVIKRRKKEMVEKSLAYFKKARALSISPNHTAEEMNIIFSSIIPWWFSTPEEVELLLGIHPSNPKAAEKQADFLVNLFTE